MTLHTSLEFPNIDRLTDRFHQESICFFNQLNKFQREAKLEKLGEPSSTCLLCLTDDLFGLRVPPIFLRQIPSKELRKYLNFRRAEHQDNWSFSDTTYKTLVLIDSNAYQFYLTSLKYTQLRLPI